MPIDAGGYLTSRGWKGKGRPLRPNSIAKPVILSQKKSLSGVGKDRDDQFAFWDHVYAVSAQTISIKLHSDEDDASSPSPDPVIIQRTHTGIISNRRPHLQSSGSCTPLQNNEPDSGYVTPKLSVIGMARREAAKRAFYSRFYRGPVITSEWESVTFSSSKESATVIEVDEASLSPAASVSSNAVESPPIPEESVADGPSTLLERAERGMRKRSKDRGDDERKRKKGKEKERDGEKATKKSKKKAKVEDATSETANGADDLNEPLDASLGRKSKRKKERAPKSHKEERKKRRKDKGPKDAMSS